MKKIKFLLFSLLFVAIVVSCSKDYTHNVYNFDGTEYTAMPSLITNNPNVLCEDLNFGCVLSFTSGKIDYYGGSGGGSGTVGIIDWWTDDGINLNWKTNDGSNVRMAVIVKGGPGASIYFTGCTTDCISSGSLLTAPIGPSSQAYGISNFSFCWSVCSPSPARKLAFKSYVTGDDIYVTTGPGDGTFIGCVPLVSGASYPLYLKGGITPGGTLTIGNFDSDPLLEVKVTGNLFTDAYLWVGFDTDPCTTDYGNYPYHQDPATSEAELIFNLAF